MEKAHMQAIGVTKENLHDGFRVLPTYRAKYAGFCHVAEHNCRPAASSIRSDLELFWIISLI
jgi:hypothetical protein